MATSWDYCSNGSVAGDNRNETMAVIFASSLGMLLWTLAGAGGEVGAVGVVSDKSGDTRIHASKDCSVVAESYFLISIDAHYHCHCGRTS